VANVEHRVRSQAKASTKVYESAVLLATPVLKFSYLVVKMNAKQVNMTFVDMIDLAKAELKQKYSNAIFKVHTIFV